MGLWYGSHVPQQIVQEHLESPEKQSVQATEFGTTAPSTQTTPKLTIAKNYGSCLNVPILMYHHVEDLSKAKQEGHAQFTIGTPFFRKDMEYLQKHGYHVIPFAQLIDAFDKGTKLPTKPIILTFDDAYEDFRTDAYPILKEFGFQATLFVPTGLVDNPGYLTWQQLDSMNADKLVTFSNHTWSHHNMETSLATITKEVDTAKEQLANHQMDQPMVFAYPYGLTSPLAEKYLKNVGYLLAVTTQKGTFQCQAKRLELPRLRIGNASLQRYGI